MSHKFVLLVCLAVATVCSAAKVPVAVYYESLCPDSAKFITEQLYPALKSELRDVVEITFVPFGKSTYSTLGSDVTFTCHHGPNECYGNKVHACAIDKIQSDSYRLDSTRESLTLDFINCLMKAGKNFPDNVYPGQRCASESQVNWENIKVCANSTEGSALLRQAGDVTLKLKEPLTSVPTILFNEQFDSKVNKNAQVNFVGTLCRYVGAPQPRICADHNAASGLAKVSGLFTTLLGIWLLRYLF
ncbi:GILT-like protein 1 [Drosophila sulfurigaster albostrigata]|uniref:GILT-like protein 1 n=1 Tax=Drosophila nasuta TaxID=42062 RepID=UPI00295ECBB9|nr:GILT-like protein 1 [Drosophila nasuta]XP_062123924.1 GILT-like protein 1 [Drosophila sulfurigaster albostrigata]